MNTECKNENASALRVLVVDDEPVILQAWKKILAGHACEIRTLSDGSDVLAAVSGFRPDVVLLDIRLPHASGVDLLRDIKQDHADTEVVMMTAYATVETAVEAVKRGAYDFLTKPFTNIEAAALTVVKAGQHRRLVLRNQELENLVEMSDSFEGLVGSSPAMRAVFETIESVAYSTSTVLVNGESGTGKELVARAIHHRSQRRARPFVAINCSALTESLLESELFGHEKGAFTGASSAKRGLFEVCDGGSIFLDEIGDIPLSTQVKLLRVLQEGEIRRVGANDIRRVDVRVIAATNADLDAARDAGSFREDLYYRLKVISLDVPPLRDRLEDIPLLAFHFLKKFSKRNNKDLHGFTPDAMDLLGRHSWPGNVRELENAIERAVVLGRANEIQVADLPVEVKQPRPARRGATTLLVDLPFRKAREVASREFEEQYLCELLSLTGGNVSEASRRAGMDRSNFRRVMKKNGLDPKRFADDCHGNGAGQRGED